jgi:hypothetical protein
MPRYRIAELLAEREFASKYGPMVAYRVRLQGDDGDVEASLNQKRDTTRPAVGEMVDGSLEQTDFGLKLKKTPPPPTGDHRHAGSSKSSQERAEIRRMAAQKAAIELLRMEIETGRVPADAKPGALLTSRIDFFYEDCRAAGENL